MLTWPTKGERFSEADFEKKDYLFPKLQIRAYTSQWFKFRHNTWSRHVFMQPGIHNNLKEMLLWCHYLNKFIFHRHLLQTSQLKTVL